MSQSRSHRTQCYSWEAQRGTRRGWSRDHPCFPHPPSSWKKLTEYLLRTFHHTVYRFYSRSGFATRAFKQTITSYKGLSSLLNISHSSSNSNLNIWFLCNFIIFILFDPPSFWKACEQYLSPHTWSSQSVWRPHHSLSRSEIMFQKFPVMLTTWKMLKPFDLKFWKECKPDQSVTYLSPENEAEHTSHLYGCLTTV